MPQLIESPTRIHAYGKGDKKSLYCRCVLLFAFGLIEGDRLNCLSPLYLPCFHPGYRMPYGGGTFSRPLFSWLLCGRAVKLRLLGSGISFGGSNNTVFVVGRRINSVKLEPF
jgi:hypothetical protein